MTFQKEIKKDLISIVIPLYNGAAYIKKTLNQILASDYKHLEVIVVNDGSSDNSFEIVSQLAESDVRIHLYTKENGGIISARNYGIEQATGEYICFCDQDDLISVHMYSKMISTIQKTKADVCLCSTGRLIDNEVQPFELFDEDRIYEKKDIYYKLLYPLLVGEYNFEFNMEKRRRYASIWKCLINHYFLEKYKLRFKRFIDFEDDLIMLIEIYLNAERISSVSDIFYIWRTNFKSESYNNKYFDDLLERQNSFMNYIITQLENANIPQNIIENYKRVVSCRNYISHLDNLANGRKLGKSISINEYLNHNIYIGNYNDDLSIYPQLKRGYIKPKILLPIIKSRKKITAYSINILLNKASLFALKYKKLARMERLIKNK